MTNEKLGFVPLTPFQEHFFFREMYEFSSKIYITVQLDKNLEINPDEFKQKIVLNLLAKEPLLRARIYYVDSKPFMKVHPLSDFTPELIDGLLEETDLDMDSKKFTQKYVASKPFEVNETLDSMDKPNWNFVVNYKQNFITFVYSHVLFDGISGVSVVNSCLSFLNEDSVVDQGEENISWSNSTGVFNPYPQNKELYTRPLNLQYDEPETPLFDVSSIKVKPNACVEGASLFAFQDKKAVTNLIKECKEHDVSFNSYMVSMLAISAYDGKDVKCKFAMPIDLRGRLKINDDVFVPKSTLGLLLTFIVNISPTITFKETVNGSKEQWEFVQKIHTLIQKAIPIAVEDLREIGNNYLIDQEKFWRKKSERSKLTTDGGAELPSFTFVLSNLSLNFKYDEGKKYNVIRSIFSQAKRPPDFFSCSMISTSEGFSISDAYYEDEPKTMENCFKRFEKIMQEKRTI